MASATARQARGASRGEGRPDSPLLPLERAALVRAYAALLAAVHHEERDDGSRR